MRLLLGVPGRSRRLARGALAGGLQEYTGEVISSSDDAHELVSTGAMDLTAPYLNMGGFAGVADVYASGFRFTNVAVAQGGLVSFAQLRFVAGSVNSKGCLLRVWAQAHDNAPTFTTTSGNITSRAKTTAFVDWDVPPWSTDQDDAATLSPDVGALVQEVVNRAGWVSGNAIVFLIETSPAITDTEFPRRRPRTFDSANPGVTRLGINTTEGQPDPDPIPTGGFSDGYDTFGLAGNEAFNPASPTLKDGTAITGDGLTYYTATSYWALHPNPSISTVNYESRIGHSDLYAVARGVQVIQGAIMRLFRLTGDLRLLDRMAEAYDHRRATSGWRITWDLLDPAKFDARKLQSLCGYPSTPSPWSPYRKVIRGTSGGTDWYTGSDMDYANTVKWYTDFAEFAWACRINRNKTSPKGYNYAAQADYWGARVEEIADAFMGPGAECWRGNYNGIYGWTTGYGAKANWGDWPFFMVNGSHTAHSTVAFQQVAARLGSVGYNIPNPATGLTEYENLMTFLRSKYVACDDRLISRRGNMLSGAVGTTDTTPLFATYTGYVASSLTDGWLSGLPARTIFTRADMTKLAAAFAGMHNGTTGATYPSMAGAAGTACELTTAVASSEARTPFQNVERGFAGMLVFAEGADFTKLNAAATNAQNSHGGGYTTPNSGVLPSYQFVHWALDAVGDLD